MSGYHAKIVYLVVSLRERKKLCFGYMVLERGMFREHHSTFTVRDFHAFFPLITSPIYRTCSFTRAIAGGLGYVIN